MDPQQRYCINCAARRGNGTNPSSRYFAAMNKKARRPIARPGGKQPGGSRAAAVGFFALLPIAVAIGVVVGNANGDGGSNGSEEALLQALKEQKSGTTTASSGSATGGTKGKSKDVSAKGKKAKAEPNTKVVAHTANGDVHEITGYKPSKAEEEASTKLVEENPEQTGSNYIKAQQNLPDVIPVGGNPNEAPSLPTGNEP
jgi:hypothetical protein